MAVPVSAQGQTPSTPRPNPSQNDDNNNSPRGGATTPPGPRSQPTTSPTTRGTTGTGTTGGTGLGERQDPTRRGLDETDNRSRRTIDRGRGQQEEATATGPGVRTATGGDAEQAQQNRAGMQQGGRRGTSARGPASGGGTGSGGIGTSLSSGGGAAVSVLGEGAFEPVFMRDIEYPELPDEGETLTYLEGPMPVNEFLQAIHLATMWNILATEEARAKTLEFIIVEKTPAQSMEILKFHGLYYTFDPDTRFLTIMTKEEFLTEEFGDVEMREFEVQYADVAYIESFVASLLSAAGRIITDQRTGRIYVWDTPDNLKYMIEAVADIDVPLEKREYMVEYADLADMEAVLTGLLSPNGRLLADGRTGQIFVWDIPNQLEQIELAVTRLDIPVESQTFEIKHIDAEDLIDSLEVVLSERGLIQVDPRYNALVITDLPARIQKIAGLIETLDRPLDTKTWVIRYAELDFIADQIETYIPAEMGDIVLNEDVHQITVTGLQSRLDQIDELINTWDIMRRQVLIEAFIVEVGTDTAREFNINWSYFDNVGNAPIVFEGGSGFQRGLQDALSAGASAVSLGQLPYAVPLYGALELDDEGNINRPVVTNIDGQPVVDSVQGTNIAAMLDYLDQKNKASILASPRVVVQDGEEALFENATRVPFVSGSTNFSNASFNSINSSNRIEFIDVGTILSVLPRVTEDENILIDVSAEDSTFILRDVVANDQTSTVPEKTVRRAETQLRVQSGETVVMGGLRRDSSRDAVDKTPFLGDLPLIGRVFQNKSKSSANSTLMIFITTTIVDHYTHPEAELVAATDADLAEAHRRNKKTFWGRLADKISNGENEIIVSIGQGGSIYSEGEGVSLSELRDAFFQAGPSVNITVVLRTHPAAPQEIVTAVTEAAMEASLKVEFDDSMTPIVPNYAGRNEISSTVIE
jgi:type II secretory pathway component GspD/PulD (secretin)